MLAVLLRFRSMLSIARDNGGSSNIDFSGNKKISKDELDEIMTTKERPWYRFWEDRPVFDPVTFGTDLERLQRLYESRGFYGTTLSPDLEVDEADALVTAHIAVHEAVPVVITEIDVQVAGNGSAQKPPPFPQELPVKRGQIFREADYQQAEQVLRAAFWKMAMPSSKPSVTPKSI